MARKRWFRPIGVLAGAALLAALAVGQMSPVGATAPPAATFNTNLLLTGSNGAAEPSIRTDKFGRSFVTGPTGVGGGCPSFRVLHDGSASKFIGRPDQGAGGGDCEWAVGPQETAVTASDSVLAFSSLTLPSIPVNKSDDGGTTFGVPNAAGTQVLGDDRMWMAADPKLNSAGLADIFMTYHDVTFGGIEMSVSVDGGQTYTNNSQLITAALLPQANGLGVNSGNELGNVVARRDSAGKLTLYSIFQTSEDATTNASGTTSLNRVYEAVGTITSDTAPPVVSWANYEIYHGAPGVRLNRIFPVTVVDKAGAVYAFWTDGNHIFYKADPTGTGTTWNPLAAPGQIANPTGVVTTIMPWADAGSGGRVDVVFYGATTGAGVQPNPQDDPNNVWNVYFAQTIDGALSWTVSQASDHVIHRGPICIDGLNCNSPPALTARDRTLLDFFQVSIDPTNGAADIAYADDHAAPGSSVMYFTRQCTGDPAITGLTVKLADCKVPPPPPTPPKGTTCPGPQVLDFSGDAPNNYPAGDGANMKNLDILNAFFGTPDSTHLRVTLTLNNLSAPPPPNNFTSGIWTVYWQLNNASPSQWWFVQASSTASSITYRDGVWDSSGDTYTTVGSTSVVGAFNTGQNGTIVWTILRGDVGNPANGAKLTNSFANTGGAYLVNGTGLRFTHAADRAPDANYGADYFVGQTCQGGGGGGGGCNEADGNGDIQGQQGGNANFQSDEDACKDGDQNGEHMKDAGAGKDFSSTQVQSVQFDSSLSTVTVYGLGISNGLPVSFLIVERAPTTTTPGFYSIQLSDGYSNSGPILSGSITI